MLSFILWSLGLLLVLFEFYLPGAIMGVAGGILLVASIFVFISKSDSLITIAIYILAVSLSLGFLIKFAIWRIRTQKPAKSIYSDASQEGFVASKFDKNAIGKTGTVLTDLKPGGYILVDGKQHQALSQTGYLTEGTEVIVMGGQEESLLVKPVNKETN
jgi:membrane-bound ClpP family serine protease